MISRYRSKISGPLLDRIDLHVFVRPLSAEEMLAPVVGECSAPVRKRVTKARETQRRRLRSSRARVNAHMTARQVLRHCPLDGAGRETLRQAIRRLGLSARAFNRILKVARTIADLDEKETIEESHLQEAVQFRVDQLSAYREGIY